MEEYVASLSRRDDLRDRGNVVASQARTDMAIGGVSLLVALYYFARDRSHPPVATLEEVHQRIWDVRRKQLFADMSAACVGLYLAYRVHRSYAPTNAELSNAILIKYLRLKGVVGDDVYEVLKGLKPYRIETLKL